MAEAMIQAIKLSKSYGPSRAVSAVSFEVNRGEVVGFLGPNGAGKTTTMKMLTCFISPTEGSARINGHDIFESSLEVRRAIGYLPEHTPLYTEMFVAEYLEFVARMRGIGSDDVQARVRRVVEQTGLREVYGKEIRALSKGYRQRVGLAQALIHEPPLLILDEPMSGLDPNQAVEIRELIREIGRERTVILSTHNLAEVQATCDRVLIISKGQLVADAATQTLTQQAGKTKTVVSVLIESGDKGAVEQDIVSRLRNFTGVESVTSLPAEGEELLIEVTPSDTRDLRAGLSRAVSEGGGVVVGLKSQERNLEEVFRQLTLEGGAADKDRTSQTN